MNMNIHLDKTVTYSLRVCMSVMSFMSFMPLILLPGVCVRGTNSWRSLPRSCSELLAGLSRIRAALAARIREYWSFN